MVEDGTHILYEQGSFYLPSDCFLVGDLCLPKEHFLEYLCRFDYFDPKELPQISDLDNLRIGYNGEYFCSLKINGIPYLLLGHFLLQQNESMKDFELTVESPGRMQVSFTRDGTLETYGYQHI